MNPIGSKFPPPVLQPLQDSFKGKDPTIVGDNKKTTSQTTPSKGKVRNIPKCQKSLLGPVRKLPKTIHVFGEACTHRLGSIFGSEKTIMKVSSCLEKIRQYNEKLYYFILKEVSGECALVCKSNRAYFPITSKPLGTWNTKVPLELQKIKHFGAVIEVNVKSFFVTETLAHEWMHHFSEKNTSSRIFRPPYHNAEWCLRVTSDPCITVQESENLLTEFKKLNKNNPLFARVETYWKKVKRKQADVNRLIRKIESPKGKTNVDLYVKLAAKTKELGEAESVLRAEVTASLMGLEGSGKKLPPKTKNICKELNKIFGEEIFNMSNLKPTMWRSVKCLSRFIGRASGPLFLAWDIYHGIQEEKTRRGYYFDPYNTALRNGAIKGSVHFFSNFLMMHYQMLRMNTDPSGEQEFIKNWNKGKQLLQDYLVDVAERHTPSDPSVVFDVIQNLYENFVNKDEITNDLLKSPEKAANWALTLRDAAEKSQKVTLEKHSEIKPSSYSLPYDYDWKIVDDGDEQKATCTIPIGDLEIADPDSLPEFLGSEEFNEQLKKQIVLASEIHPYESSINHDDVTTSDLPPPTPESSSRKQSKKSPEVPKLTEVSIGPLCPALPQSLGVVLDFDKAASVGLGVSSVEEFGKGLSEGGGGFCLAVTISLSKEGLAALCTKAFLLPFGIGVGAIALGATMQYFSKKKRERADTEMTNSLKNTFQQDLFLYDKLVPATERLQKQLQEGLISPREALQRTDDHIRHLSKEVENADHRANKAENYGDKNKRNFHHSALEGWSWILQDLKCQKDDMAAKVAAENALRPLMNLKAPELFSRLKDAVQKQECEPTVYNYYFIGELASQFLKKVDLNLESDVALIREMSELKIPKPFEFPLYEINEKAHGKLDPYSAQDYSAILNRVKRANKQMSLNSADASDIQINVIDFMELILHKWEGKKDKRRTFTEDREAVTISKQQYKARCRFLRDTIEHYKEILGVYNEEGNSPLSLSLPIQLPEPCSEGKENPSDPVIDKEAVFKQLEEWREKGRRFKHRLDDVTLVVKSSLDLVQKHTQRFGTPLQKKLTSLCIEVNNLFPKIAGMGLLYPFSRFIGDPKIWEETWCQVLDKRLQSFQRPFSTREKYNSSIQTAIGILRITTEFFDLTKNERTALSILSFGARTLSDITTLHTGYLKYLEEGTIDPETISLGLRTAVDLSQWTLKGKEGELNEDPEYYERWEVARFAADAPLMMVNPLYFGFSLLRLGCCAYTKSCEEEALEAMLRNIEAHEKKSDGKRDHIDYVNLSSFLSHKIKTAPRTYDEADSEIVKSAKIALFYYEISRMYLNKSYKKVIERTKLHPYFYEINFSKYTEENHFPLIKIITPLIWRLEALLHLGQISSKDFRSNLLQVRRAVNQYIDLHQDRRDLRDDQQFQDYVENLKNSMIVFELEEQFYAIRETLHDDEKLDLTKFDNLRIETETKLSEIGDSHHNLKPYCDKMHRVLKQLYPLTVHRVAHLAYRFASKKDPLTSQRYITWVEKALQRDVIDKDSEIRTILGGTRLTMGDSALSVLKTLEEISFANRNHLTWFFIAEAFYKFVTTFTINQPRLTLLGKHHFHLVLEHCIENFILEYQQFKQSHLFQNLEPQEQQFHMYCAEMMKHWRNQIMQLQARRCLATLNEDPDAFLGTLLCSDLHSINLNRSFPLSNRVIQLKRAALAIKFFAIYCFFMMSTRLIWSDSSE